MTTLSTALSAGAKRFSALFSLPSRKALSDLRHAPSTPLLAALEPRGLLSFSNWSSIGPAIAVVPTTAGQLPNVSVIDFGKTLYTGALSVKNMPAARFNCPSAAAWV